MKQIISNIFKTIIIVLSLLNIVWFLVFNYRPVTEILNSRNMPEESGSSSAPSASGMSLTVPLNSLKYNGIGEFDPLKDVYVVDDKGVLVDSAEISYSISTKTQDNIREKTIEYEAAVGDETFYGKRNLSLGIDYSGPSISVEGDLPFCRTGDASSYAGKAADAGVLTAQDGFGNDISGNLSSELKRFDRSQEFATITFSATNEFGDIISTDYQVPMNDTGLVLTLLNDRAVMKYGETFRVKDFVDQCYLETESDGKTVKEDLLGSISYEGSVDTYSPGTYNITVYAKDYEGNRSIGRGLEVIVLEQEVSDEGD